MKKDPLKKIQKISGEITQIFLPIVMLCLLSFPMIFGSIKKTNQNFPDQFIGKNYLISWINNFKLHVLHDKIFTGLYVGKNDWLVYTGETSLDDIQNTNQFSQEQLAQMTTRLDNFCSHMTKINTKFILLITPNKNTIYPEYLPPEMSPMNKGSRLDQLMAAWKGTENCQIVDLRETLLNAKKTQQVYFSTDTHWNDYGAFYGYQVLANIMKEDFPELPIHAITDYNFERVSRPGDLTSVNFGNFNVPEMVDAVGPKYKSGVIIRRYYSNDALYTTGDNTVYSFLDNENLPDAFIFYDSFFNVMYPFIIDSFHEGYYQFALGVDLELIEKIKPDFVIVEITERYLENRILQLPLPN